MNIWFDWLNLLVWVPVMIVFHGEIKVSHVVPLSQVFIVDSWFLTAVFLVYLLLDLLQHKIDGLVMRLDPILRIGHALACLLFFDLDWTLIIIIALQVQWFISLVWAQVTISLKKNVFTEQVHQDVSTCILESVEIFVFLERVLDVLVSVE